MMMIMMADVHGRVKKIILNCVVVIGNLYIYDIIIIIIII